MVKCSTCGVEMLDGRLSGKSVFKATDLDHTINNFYVQVKTGAKKSFLGIKYDETVRARLVTKVCPQCGRVEMYADSGELTEG